MLNVKIRYAKIFKYDFDFIFVFSKLNSIYIRI